MRANRNCVASFALFAALCLVGCDGQAPDLIAEKGASAVPFCYLNKQTGKLMVTVKNQGTAAAPASKTRVEFRGTPVVMPTPAIPANGSVVVEFAIPQGCFSADCFFKICVDSDNQVKETAEGNNCADGWCIG